MLMQPVSPCHFVRIILDFLIYVQRANILHLWSAAVGRSSCDNVLAGRNGVRVWVCGVVAFGREYVYGKSGVESCRPVSEKLENFYGNISS